MRQVTKVHAPRRRGRLGTAVAGLASWRPAPAPSPPDRRPPHRDPRLDRFAYWVAYLQGPGGWRTFRLFTRFLATPEAYNLAQTNPPFLSFGPQKLAHARLARW